MRPPTTSTTPATGPLSWTNTTWAAQEAVQDHLQLGRRGQPAERDAV